MKAAGLEVLPFTRNEVGGTPAGVARELEEAYRRRAASTPPSSVKSSSPTWT
jgi:hypothetical protein